MNIKKKKIGYILITIITIFTITYSFCNYTLEVKADSGFDSDYDSSWSSSSDMDSNWSSGESSTTTDIDAITFIIIIIIIIVLVIIEEKNKQGNDNSLLLEHEKEMAEEEIKKYIPNFNKEEFLHRRYMDYLEIQKAWSNFDDEKLKEYLTNELYNQYAMQLDTLKVKNQQNIMSSFTYLDAMITNITKENNQLTLKMELIVKFIDYIEENGTLVRGSKDREITMHYDLTFITNLTSNLNICPNCGAKLEKGSSKKCEYCGSIITGVPDEWVMSKKEAKRQK